MTTKKWSEARLRNFIISALRGATTRYPPKYETLNESFVDKRVNSKTGRVGKHFQCASCRGIFPSKDVQVDHIQPVVDPVDGFKDWNEYISRLFCEKEGFQVLCVECHDIKTENERQIRKINNDKRKENS